MTINNKTKTTSILTITFFAALLLIPTGMNPEAFAILTFTDDFDTDNWTTTDDTNLTLDEVTDERIEFDISGTTVDDAIYYDLGEENL